MFGWEAPSKHGGSEICISSRDRVLDLESACVETQLTITLSKWFHLSKFISSSTASQGCYGIKPESV